MARTLKRNKASEDDAAAAENETLPPAGTLAEEVRHQAGEERAARVQLTIEELLDQCSNNDGQVAFKKIDLVTRVENHLERISIEAVMPDIFEFTRNRYGGGKYKASFYVLDDGEFRPVTTRVIDIEASIPPGEFFKSQNKTPEKDGTAAMVEMILEKMNAGKKTGEIGTSELLLLMMEQQQKSSNQMLAMFTTVIGAMSKNSGGVAGQSIDMLNALAVFDKLKGNSGDMVKPVIDMMEFARKMMVDKARKDSGDESSPWADMLAQALTAVMARMGGGQLPQLQSGETVVSAPGPAPVIRPMPDAPADGSSEIEVPSSNAVIETVTQTDDMKMVHLLPIKMIAPAILPKLIEAIELNEAEPEDAIEQLNNPLSHIKLTDAQYDDLVSILKTETWPEELFGGAEKISKHRAWFDKLRDLILKQSEEERSGMGPP